jgi:phospholipase C
MDGFVANAINHTGIANAPLVMRSFAPEHVPIISTLATDFALVDNYFSSVPGPTYINRLYSTSATSWGFGTNDLNQTLHGWPQLSIFRALSNANVTWRAYLEEAATAWLYQDARHLDTLANCKQMNDFFTDVAAGTLPTFTWLDPSYFTIPGITNATDQHP